MHKKALYLMLVVLALTLAATASAQETLYDAWKGSEGKRGTLKHQDGECEYVFTFEENGEQVIVRVGRDYVEFARFTKEKGERRTHRLVPMSRVALRRSRLSQ